MQRFAVGDSIAAVRAALGPPTVSRDLDNDSPWTMGASVVEYGFADPVLRLEGEPGGATAPPARAVQFVVDPGGRVLRLLRNPNAPGPESRRTLRGPAGPAHAVLVPPGATPLPPFPDQER
ncbi:hypothetical protein [Roseospira goensis]|uniref:Uncharacterized protein n=1 Tax=Roseospira goensis TaxID=391922 RepID=A0A7W6RYU1_9PROT|nr:hypothetical protein [Roseospira goensis]MBB4285057.1 hypothetical protein [Roseospira goensis]